MLGIRNFIPVVDPMYCGISPTRKPAKPRYCMWCGHRLADSNTTGECFRKCDAKKKHMARQEEKAAPVVAMDRNGVVEATEYHQDDIPISPMKGYADKINIARAHGYDSFRAAVIGLTEKLGGPTYAAKALWCSNDTIYRALYGKRRRGKK